ncbi:MAG: hypothetical protein WC966_10205 [Bradymonadales bacterium]|jgi:hypothetical protein
MSAFCALAERLAKTAHKTMRELLDFERSLRVGGAPPPKESVEERRMDDIAHSLCGGYYL